MGCGVWGCSVGDLGCHSAGVAPCWLHPVTHTNVLGFIGPGMGPVCAGGCTLWLMPVFGGRRCAPCWLHHGDHSLALLIWVAATPGLKKKPYPRLLASFHTGVRPVGAPYRTEAMHHCDPGDGLAIRCALVGCTRAFVGALDHLGCVTVLGLRFKGSFRLRPFGFLRFSAPFP